MARISITPPWYNYGASKSPRVDGATGSASQRSSPLTTSDSNIPCGYCQCGCGQKTTIATRTSRARGWAKGQPVRFIKYHQSTAPTPSPSPNPQGVCQCGCGRPTAIAAQSSRKRGTVKGRPNLYLPGHGSHVRMYSDPGPNPTGLCMCGCGRQTPLAQKTDRREGHVKGTPTRYIMGHNRNSNTITYKVDEKTGCWIWQGALSRKGYGHHKKRIAHRYFYEQRHGSLPHGQPLDHLCRNRACVNPDHLEPVSDVENSRRGKVAKLTAEQVKQIRYAHKHRLQTMETMAKVHGVVLSTIEAICYYRTWRGV